jgi:CelD/BcsL family acetyltransferase involved in cellulose biosynthesis
VLKPAACVSLQELDSLRAEWDSLLARSDSASPFATWEWVDACWRNAEPGKKSLLLTARDDAGNLVGLLPLATYKRFGLLPAVEVLGCTRIGYPQGDYGGPVAERGREDEVWAAMLRYLATRRWTTADLRNCMVPLSSRPEQMARAYSEPAAGRGWGVRIAEADVCRLLSLRATFDDYLAGLSSNSRQNIRRKLRKLTEAGVRIEVVDLNDKAERNAALEALYDYHQARWQDNPSGGCFPDNYARDLHRYLTGKLSGSDRTELRVARNAGGKIIGAIYNFRLNGTGYFYTIGVSQEQEWSHLSLGVCLLADSIRAAIEAGCHTFDLLRGDHDYKQHFGGQTTNNLRVTIYRYAWLPRVEGALRKAYSLFRKALGVVRPTAPTAHAG